MRIKKENKKTIIRKLICNKRLGTCKRLCGVNVEDFAIQKPDDWIIATNKEKSVKSFINLVAKKLKLNLEWKSQGINEVAIDKKNNKIVIDVNKKFFRPTEVEYLKGNYKKAKTLLKWKPKHNIETLIDDMINYEIKNS